MPIYEYKCSQCNDRFELIQSFSDKPLKKCKKCGGQLHKLVSECAFHLKGTGWYVTDYGKSGSANKSKPAGTAAKSEKADQAESKPAASSSAATSSTSPAAAPASPSQSNSSK